MKKLILLSAAGILCSGAYAQHNMLDNGSKGKTHTAPFVKVEQKNSFLSSLQRTTSTPFAGPETFGTGTSSTLPTGWTRSGGGSWKWMNVASTSAYTLGALNSTTAADGWMIFDSDSIGTANGSLNPIEGYLISPTYNCSAHASVQVNFQQYYRKFNDSCFIEVSNNGGTSWTSFRLNVNNNLSTNSSLPTNPTATSVNISSVAANQANVKLRFHYIGPQGGGYSWMIDDMTLSELDPVEVAIDKSGLYMYGGANVGFNTFGTIPMTFVDSLAPVTELMNYGSTAPNVNVSANIYSGSTSVYSKSIVFNALPVGAYDSMVDFTNQGLYKPNATGSYAAVFNAAATGDAVPANNIDSVFFNVSDSTWSMNSGSLTGSYYIHRPTSQNEASFSIGTLFQLPAGKSDTLTGASVAFGSGTTAGAQVAVQIYTFDPGTSSWSPVATTFFKTLTAADIPASASALTYSYFPVDYTNGINNLILSGGADGATFAAVAIGKNIPASSTVLVYASELPGIPSITGTAGVSDTSDNTGSFSFASSGLPGGISGSAPLVRMHFGGARGLSVNNVFSNTNAVNAYPNPANTNITITYSLQKAADVNVKLVNTLGQVVKSATSKAGANQTMNTTFATNDMAAGVYFYTIEANGERVTNRFVVAH